MNSRSRPVATTTDVGVEFAPDRSRFRSGEAIDVVGHDLGGALGDRGEHNRRWTRRTGAGPHRVVAGRREVGVDVRPPGAGVRVDAAGPFLTSPGSAAAQLVLPPVPVTIIHRSIGPEIDTGSTPRPGRRSGPVGKATTLVGDLWSTWSPWPRAGRARHQGLQRCRCPITTTRGRRTSRSLGPALRLDELAGVVVEAVEVGTQPRS